AIPKPHRSTEEPGTPRSVAIWLQRLSGLNQELEATEREAIPGDPAKQYIEYRGKGKSCAHMPHKNWVAGNQYRARTNHTWQSYPHTSLKAVAVDLCSLVVPLHKSLLQMR